MIHVNKLEEVPVTKSVVLHSFSHPYKLMTLIHVNELEEVPLRTITAVLNSLYPPPHPPTHTKKDEVNRRFESEEVPLTTAHFRSLLPHPPRTRRR